jgi:N6-L-threonylcarbamoyladenine synthase
MKEEGKKRGLGVHFPKMEYCTDNGAMIAYVGWLKLRSGVSLSPDDVTAAANLQFS